jgi:hypothetical protein
MTKRKKLLQVIKILGRKKKKENQFWESGTNGYFQNKQTKSS